MMMQIARVMVLAVGLVMAAASARAQVSPPVSKQSVTFSINQTTSVGQSVFVLGDIPELGSNVLNQAVKLDPSAYPIWRVTIAIPAGTSYSYRYYLRNDGPGQTSSNANGTAVGSVLNGSTSAAAVTPSSKTVFLTWNVASPRMWWRQGAGAFAPVSMTRYGAALTGRAGETQWFVPSVGVAGRAIDFYFTDQAGGSRYPASGNYTTALDGVFVQDGQVYSYIPAASVSASRRDYNPAAVPSLFSPQLNETRGYRVYLPRGYSEHPSRRYPVLYMHDGQNVFESGPFGSWNAAGTIQSLQASGAMREIIVVGLDNGPQRISDYSPPSDAGRGDRYLQYVAQTVKPVIDANYRTLTDAANTGALGSSMGGVISAYFAYASNPSLPINRFSRLGLMSTAWQVTPNLLNLVKTDPARNVRIYMDSGDSGTSSDNYWLTYGVRDAWAGPASAKYAVEGALRHVIGYGQQHNEAAWAARLPSALTFLFPAVDEPNTLLRTVYNASLDRDASGVTTIDDLYAQSAQPVDLNLDGLVDTGDAALQERFLRRASARDEAGQQR